MTNERRMIRGSEIGGQCGRASSDECSRWLRERSADSDDTVEGEEAAERAKSRMQEPVRG